MQANEILLPENWPDMVRRAMLNAVALAHYAMVYTRESRSQTEARGRRGGRRGVKPYTINSTGFHN